MPFALSSANCASWGRSGAIDQPLGIVVDDGRPIPWYGVHMRSLASLLSLVVLASACTRDNPAFDGGSGDGTGKGTLDGTDGSLTTGTLDSAFTGAGESGDAETTGSVDGTTTTGPIDCRPPPDDAVGYGRCDGCVGNCLQQQSGPPIIFDASVCATECQGECDCPAPDSGMAVPVCERGCVLECGEEQACPTGMVCLGELGRCMWSHAYGPCNDSCIAGYCLLVPMVGGVCPVLDCMVGGKLDPSLCPSPSSGNATPICFEPQEPAELQGQGWCVLDCSEEQACPLGMQCSGGTCIHPG
jgi:hypothetical protein